MSLDEHLVHLAKKVGTPYYLIEHDAILKSFASLREAFASFAGEVKITYAVKANPDTKVLRVFRELATLFDVLTPGEIDLLLSVEVSPEMIAYTSVSETYAEFRFAIKKGVRSFVIGSSSGLRELTRASSESKITPKIALRVNPGLRARANISTSGKTSKFGVPISGKGSASELVQILRQQEGIDFVGLTFHLGTQVTNPSFYVEAIERVLRFTKTAGIGLKSFNIGGGFPVRYLRPVPAIEEFGSAITSSLNEWVKRIGTFGLIVEPGRYLVAESGLLVSSVTNIKEFNDKRVAITDASYNQVPDVLLGQHYPIRAISDGKKRRRYAIAGNLCDGNDWLEPKPILLPTLSNGDLIILQEVGAYSNAFRMNFCNAGVAPVIVKEKSGFKGPTQNR